MVRFWTNFAKSGDPNHPEKAGLPEWQPYARKTHATMLLNSSPHTTEGVRTAKLDIWDEVFSTD
jgi:carboxylesterase type B